MRIVVHARPPLYDVRKSKADFVAALHDYALILWLALDGFEPEPGARVTIEVALRTRKKPRMVNLCDSVVGALEMIGIDPAKFDRLEYKRLSDRRSATASDQRERLRKTNRAASAGCEPRLWARITFK